MILSFIGLLVGLGLLVYLIMRGFNIIIAAILSSIIVSITGKLNIMEALTGYYMDGFTGFFASWFLVFLLGALFGKIMEDTHAAKSIAEWVKNKLGAKRAVFAVVAACAVMTYGGVSVFIVAFTVYPIAASLFKEANLPHRFIPASMIFGSSTFTMTSPGSPEIQNIIPTEFFGTTSTAGGIIGYIIGTLMMVVGGLVLGRLVKNAVSKGEVFSLPSERMNLVQSEVASSIENNELYSLKRKKPNIILSILPLVMVVISLNILTHFMPTDDAVMISLFLGLAVAWVTMYKNVKDHWKVLSKGTENSIVAIANTCAVVAFGAVASKVPAFNEIVKTFTDIPGFEYAGLGIAVTVIAGITGSASGGLGIALPILSPIFTAQGLDPGAMHRISTIASGGLDSLPHNGHIVTTVRGIAGETHKSSYSAIFILCALIPLCAMTLAIVLYTLFY